MSLLRVWQVTEAEAEAVVSGLAERHSMFIHTPGAVMSYCTRRSRSFTAAFYLERAETSPVRGDNAAATPITPTQ